MTDVGATEKAAHDGTTRGGVAEADVDLEQYRVGLTGYCYRMLGSAFEADDAEVMRTGQPIVNRQEPINETPGAYRWLSTTKVPSRAATRSSTPPGASPASWGSRARRCST